MGNNVPEIRFKGFDGETYTKTVSNVCSISTGKSNTQDNIPGAIYPFFVRSPKIETSDKYLYDEEAVLTVGDGVGTGKVYHYINGKYDLHQRVYRMFDFNGVTGHYFYYYFSTHFYDRVKRMSAKNSVDSVRMDMISEMMIHVPAIEEQTLIGNFFKQLDERIAIQRQELEAIKSTKQGFLQKMFPAEGETVPQLRFPGFSGEWENKKLEQSFDERNERSSEGELLSVTINSGIVRAITLDRKDNSSEDKSNYKKVETGDIAYNSMRMWQGASGKSSFSGIVSPAYTVIIPKENASPLFFSYLFKLHRSIQIFQANSQGLTSDTWNLKFPFLKKIKFRTPSIEEQTHIGDFFKKLDNTIALHQQELDALEQTKKAFLQKMFV